MQHHFEDGESISVHRHARCRKWLNLLCVTGKMLNSVLSKIQIQPNEVTKI